MKGTKRVIMSAIFFLVYLLPQGGFAAQVDEPQEEPTKLQQIVVTATKTSHTLEDVPVDTVLISKEDIEKSNAKTVSALLAEVPGFNFSQQPDLAGSMGYKNTIRGLNVESRYMLVLVDGQRVFTGYHSGGMSSAGFSHNVNVVPVSMIERIEVVKGPGSALYGSDAVVGVLNIITKKPTDKTTTTVGVSYGQYELDGNTYLMEMPEDTTRTTYEAHAAASGKINEKVGVTLSYSYESNEGINPTTYDVYQHYVHGQVFIDATDKLSLRAGGEFTNWESEGNSVYSDRKESAPRIWATGEYAINSRHKVILKSYYQQLDADFDDYSYGIQDADVSYSDVELQYMGNLFEKHLMTGGLEVLAESLDTNLVDDKSSTTTSIYLQDEWGLMQDSLILVPGVRYDDNDVYGQKWNPKFSAMYLISPETRIRASAGWSFKAPTALQTSANPINHVTMYVVSNSDLDPERAFTWQAGVEHEFFDDRVLFNITYYNTDIEDMITMPGTGETLDGLPVFSYMNVDNAKLQGVEITARAALTDALDLMLSYAYTDAKDDDTGERLEDTPENSVSARLNYRNTTYRFGGSLSLSYASDQVNTDYGMPELAEYTDDFTTVGLKLWKDLPQGFRVTLEVDNLFDEALTGSDTIYARQTFIAKLQWDF